MNKTAAVIMHPPFGASPGERMVNEARIAAIFDLIELLRYTGVDDVFIVSQEESLRAVPARLVSLSVRPFHFGTELKSLISRFGIDRLIYFGSGNGMLLSKAQIELLIEFTSRSRPSALFNNFYSCDFAAISRATALLTADLPPIDNALGFALADSGFSCFSLPRNLSTQFDIDTPTDLFLLAAAGMGGAHLRRTLLHYDLHHPSLPAMNALLTSRSAHVYLIGRASPRNWMQFETAVACRTSGLAEGRGMRAYPEGRGTITGQLIHRDGIDTFISQLAASCDGALIDTRPLLSQAGSLPPPADRFASDLFRPDLIQDRLWAEFTRVVIEAPIPIILGGHSLLSGGLHILPKIAWKGRDLPRRLHPETIDWEKELS